MNEALTNGGTLEKAFHSFERAAHSLEANHEALLNRVDRLERQLLDANRRLETVLDALSNGVAVVSPDGRLLRTNKAFVSMDLVSPGGELRNPVLAALVRSAPTAGGSSRLRHESAAGWRDLAATVIPVGDEPGTHLLTIQDITDIRREEAEGGRRQRLEALGRMAAELAHEVRNPLGSIRLFASMLQEDLKNQEGKKVMAEQILGATAGLEATVSNLLAFASPARGACGDIDIAELAREACALLSAMCSIRDVELSGPSTDDSCVMTADPEGVRQIVLNLVGNSLAATESGGRITVTTENCGDAIALTVEDTGRGIAGEDLPRVFDPFFTRTAGGTGLGLSIVHGIVEHHGGRITIDSQTGRGTRARVYFPSHAPEMRGNEEADV